MKRVVCFILSVILVFSSFSGCSSGTGVPQEQYDAVVAERDSYKNQLETLTGKSVESSSEMPTVTGKFDADDVIKQLQVTEYVWDTLFGNYVALVVKNNSSSLLRLTTNVLFKDDSGALIGTQSNEVRAFEPGAEAAILFQNDEAFSSYEYSLQASEETSYKGAVLALSCDTNISGDKAILSVTNNGSLTAEFVEYTVLFMSGDQVVDYGWGYCVDSNNEIAPGKTEHAEARAYGNEFDSVKVYLTGRAKK